MNYENSELLEQIAGAYVLGAQRQRVRRRFERLCLSQPTARAATKRWEDRLLPLALAVQPIVPSARCWSAIEKQLAIGTPSSHRRRWQAVAAASLIAVLLLVGRLTIFSPPHWQTLAVLAPASAEPLWRVERSPDSTHIAVETVGRVALAGDKAYELWILPGGGANPVSLGLLPRSGRLDRPLSAAQRALLASAAQVAVSVEPAGGSPTGLPTGPVIIVASVAKS